MYLSGVNYSSLSDEELLNKAVKMQEYLDMQIRLGHTGTVNNVQYLLSMLEYERRDRAIRKSHTDTTVNNKPIELGKIDEEN